MENAPLLKEVTSSQMANLDKKQLLVVWPIASLEQHGPHLPLGTDLIVIESVAERVRGRLGNRLPLAFGPSIPLGMSSEHLGFPGTVSLGPTAFIRLVDDIAASLASHGIKHLLFLNGHGGNTDILHALGPDVRRKHDVRTYFIDLWGSSFFDDVIEEVFPGISSSEIHAATVETSIMLHLRPELVGPLPDKEAEGEALLPAGKAADTVCRSWIAEDYGASGIIGSIREPSAEAGGRVVEFAVNKVAAMLEKIAAAAGEH